MFHHKSTDAETFKKFKPNRLKRSDNLWNLLKKLKKSTVKEKKVKWNENGIFLKSLIE